MTKVFDKQLRIKRNIKEWPFDGSMPSFSNSNKAHYFHSLYSEYMCESLSAYVYEIKIMNTKNATALWSGWGRLCGLCMATPFSAH